MRARGLAFVVGLGLGAAGCVSGYVHESLFGELDGYGGIVVVREHDAVVVAFERDGEPRTVTYEVVAER